MPRSELVKHAHGPGAPDTGVAGLYDHALRAIYLPEGWNPADLVNMSTLVHELVHHLQECHQLEFVCAGQREKDPYRLQLEWLRARGVADPHEIEGLDSLTIFFSSSCLSD